MLGASNWRGNDHGERDVRVFSVQITMPRPYFVKAGVQVVPKNDLAAPYVVEDYIAAFFITRN